MAVTESTTSTFKPIHASWVTIPTKQHLAGDDGDLTGTGPDGWGLYEEGNEGEGYFAWFHHKAEAENVVQQHNAAVADAEELETLRYEIGLLPIGLEDFRVEAPIVVADRHLPASVEAGKVPGVVAALKEAAERRQRREG